MAKMKTPAVPDVFPAHSQPAGLPVTSAAGRDATPPHRRRSTPQHRPHGVHPQRSPADVTPDAAPASEAAQGSGSSTPAPAETTLTLRVSASLLRQLEVKARDEGVSPFVLATELLAEGLVLRTWEILERQAANRLGGGTMPQKTAPTAHGAHASGRGHDRRGGSHRGRRMPQRPGGNVMDDQAAFMEYVRTQERKRR